MPRTATKDQFKTFSVEVSNELLARINQEVRDRNTNRCQLVRQAIERELARGK